MNDTHVVYGRRFKVVARFSGAREVADAQANAFMAANTGTGLLASIPDWPKQGEYVENLIADLKDKGVRCA